MVVQRGLTLLGEDAIHILMYHYILNLKNCAPLTL
jgi:hypothetical protein